MQQCMLKHLFKNMNILIHTSSTRSLYVFTLNEFGFALLLMTQQYVEIQSLNLLYTPDI